MAEQKTAIVTGANRGIGLEICRQLSDKDVRVLLTARDEAKGSKAAESLGSTNVFFHQLDITDEESIQKLRGFAEKEMKRVDILVNNAGIYPDGSTPGTEIGLDVVRKTLEINTLGALRMCQVFLPIMKKNGYGRIVNISSTMGALNSMTGGYLAYRVSKAGLNAVTRVLASEVDEPGILINTMCPGWVRTDMGGPDARLSVEEGADTAVWLALAEKGASGRFFYKRREKEW